MTSVLYPGSFDPVTKGHIDVILRLRAMFDRVLVLVADSPRKNYFFTKQERVKLIEEAFTTKKGIEVKAGQGLTVDHARTENIHIIARSVRSLSDWEHEAALADANRKLYPGIETFFIMADAKFAFISSSLVREIAHCNGDTSEFVPENVVQAFKKRGQT